MVWFSDDVQGEDVVLLNGDILVERNAFDSVSDITEIMSCVDLSFSEFICEISHKMSYSAIHVFGRRKRHGRFMCVVDGKMLYSDDFYVSSQLLELCNIAAACDGAIV